MKNALESGAHFLLVSFVAAAAADATASLACSGMIRATDDSNRERRDSKASDALIDVGDDGEVDEGGGRNMWGKGESRCHLHISEKYEEKDEKTGTTLIAMQPLVADQAYMPQMKAMCVPFHMVYGRLMCY